MPWDFGSVPSALSDFRSAISCTGNSPATHDSGLVCFASLYAVTRRHQAKSQPHVPMAIALASTIFNTTTEFRIPDPSFTNCYRGVPLFSPHSVAKRLKNHFFIASTASR